MMCWCKDCAGKEVEPQASAFGLRQARDLSGFVARELSGGLVRHKGDRIDLARIRAGMPWMRFMGVLGRNDRSQLSQVHAAELPGISARTSRRPGRCRRRRRCRSGGRCRNSGASISRPARHTRPPSRRYRGTNQERTGQIASDKNRTDCLACEGSGQRPPGTRLNPAALKRPCNPSCLMETANLHAGRPPGHLCSTNRA